ncbi:DUF4912 domain-containing protein [Cyanobium sp. BA20m-p-22]|uniref:DUF4912 domain-containing protein n=1 Tax=Cyanobium sp. BA20m-p-22 TaxID=2823704 RepID=UPI0020CF55DD|nr:DUF4912 domain-containing protein [Cyanobium sp. BA20m-p-22]MCP9908561.1 DUF4912 domain-containing protein [Cyanobium sp. BA20m-p-22]
MTSPSSNPSLFTKTVAQLRELARSLGVRSSTRLAKKELVEALAQAQQEASAHNEPAKTSSAVSVSAAPSQVTFLPRDPQWAYVFWSISTADRKRAAAAGGQQLCLRVADVTGLPLGASHPHALQELVVPANATEWYLPVPLSDRDYRVELGYRLSGGGWLALAVSSVARVPAEGPSPVVADLFVPFSLEGPIGVASQPVGGSGGVEHERLYQLASAGSARSRRIGSEVLHEQDFNQDQGDLLNASGAGVWASGRSESGSGLQRQRSFWLVADAELIVYGATEPSASLFIGEEQIALEADGTFRVHVPFRDGQQLYPIRAVAADGEQERAIRMEFQRRTPEARVNSREGAQLAWF